MLHVRKFVFMFIIIHSVTHVTWDTSYTFFSEAADNTISFSGFNYCKNFTLCLLIEN